MNSGIYKITNPKGAVYIGQSKNIHSRIARYKKLQCCKTQLLLYRSFLKYGIDSHKFEILLEGNLDKKELNRLEKEYITNSNSYRKNNPFGMNLTTGGDSIEYDDSIRAKMSKTRKENISKGITWSKLTIEQVKEIKQLLAENVKQRDIAKKYNVQSTQICNIKHGRCWTQITI